MSIYNEIASISEEILDEKSLLNEKVKNGYEAYGILSKKSHETQQFAKRTKEKMGDILSSLDDLDNGELYTFMTCVTRLAEATADLAVKVIEFNGVARRIIKDLEDEEYSTTPIEKYIEGEK